MNALTPVDRHRRHFEHEKTTNERVLMSIRSVPEGSRNKPEFHYACDRFAHLLLTRLEWLRRIRAGGAQASMSALFPEGVEPGDLAVLREKVEREWERYLVDLSPTELDRHAEYKSTDGSHWLTPVADILDHVYTHGFYHRGQIASAVGACGGDRAVQDLIVFVREGCR